MKIVKYKKLNSNKYQLTLENNEHITLYEDVILKENLLIKKSIDDIDNLLFLNMKYSIHDVALQYISIRMRSTKELRNYLLKKDYLESDIDNVIERLSRDGYLSDELYSKCYIHDRINLSMDGPYKIARDLDSMEISDSIYNKYLQEFDDNLIYERITKYLNKQIKLNKKSMYIFKNKMLINLGNLGYSKEYILKCLEEINFDQDKLRYIEQEKLYKKLGHKYSGSELDKKVREKLYQKGFFE